MTIQNLRKTISRVISPRKDFIYLDSGEVCVSLEDMKYVGLLLLFRKDKGGKFVVVDGVKQNLRGNILDFYPVDSWNIRQDKITENAAEHDFYKKKYIGTNLGAYTPRMPREDAEAFLEKEYERISYRYWKHPPQILANMALLTIRIEPDKIKKRIEAIKDKALELFDQVPTKEIIQPLDGSEIRSGYWAGLRLKFEGSK
jgi:hypothetical protein